MPDEKNMDEASKIHRKEGLTEEEVEGHQLHRKEGATEDDVEGHQLHRK
jgi:hypothetical protein